MNRTRAGLILRAGTDLSAHSMSSPVIGEYRYAAIAFGRGALRWRRQATYFSMVITPMWAQQMTAGRRLVRAPRWWCSRAGAPGGCSRAPYFFGVLMTLKLYAKACSFAFLPSQFWAAMGYSWLSSCSRLSGPPLRP